MSDDEMKRWQAGFRGVTQVPTALRAHLDRQARRRWILGASLFAVMVLESSVGIALLATDSSLHARAMAVFLIGVSVLLGVLFLRLQRRIGETMAFTPDELLALFDRRLLAVQWIARRAPWFASLVAVGVSLLIVTADAPTEVKLPGVAMCAIQLVVAWLLPRLLGPRLARQSTLIEQWRRDLSG
jgi:hypothetical protein